MSAAQDRADPSPARRIALAIDALRHGWAVRIGDHPPLLPVETASGIASGDRLLISAARAATLKLANQREAARPEAPVILRGVAPFSLEEALVIADPALDLQNPLKGPFLAAAPEDEDAARVAMELARIAGILPAFLIGPAPAPTDVARLEPGDLSAWSDPTRLEIATRARLPIEAEAQSEIVAFRSPDDLREHAALVMGQPDAARVPLVRLHSECLTGDVFGSLKCDCGPQLDAALAALAVDAGQGGWGAVLYLRQEGRGIGLINKLRAYRLQDQGFDTIEANQRLGLPSEARDFPIAARMLRLLEMPRVRLMTNNPQKVAALAAQGIEVIERVPLVLPPNPHNAAYLATKRDRSGHLL